jgi:hypothetical protein
MVRAPTLSSRLLERTDIFETSKTLNPESFGLVSGFSGVEATTRVCHTLA